MGYNVDIVLMTAEGDLLSHVPDHARVVDLRVSRIRRLPLPLARYLRAERPQALLVAMWPFSVVALLAARGSFTRTRVVVSDHNMLSLSARIDPRPAKPRLRLSLPAYRLADGIVAVSGGVAADIARLGGLPTEAIRVIYNPAAHGRELPSAATARPPGPKRIIAVGTLKPQKDHKTLITAFARLRATTPVKLTILGDGALRAELEEHTRRLGVDGDVDLPGFIADPYPHYLASDLFVLSSRYEGFANVIVEALECGLPVVATDCRSGPSEILDGERYGRLVPVGDVRALAEAMAEALDEKPDSLHQAERARDFTAEKAARAYLELLDPAPP
jgi:glycosyltransferase involved in cell wall biosynthesis